MDLDPLIVACADVTDVFFHGSKVARVGLSVAGGDVRRRAACRGQVAQISELPVRGAGLADRTATGQPLLWWKRTFSFMV